MFLILQGKNKLDFLVEISKMKHFAFPTKGHPWDRRLVSDLHKNRSQLHVQWPLKILVNLKKNIESYEVPKG